MSATIYNPHLSLGSDVEGSDLRSELFALLEGVGLPIGLRALVHTAISQARRSDGKDRREVGERLEEVIGILLPPSQRKKVSAALEAAGYGVGVDAGNERGSQEIEELVAPVGGDVDPSASRALAREACKEAGLSRFTMQRVLNAVGELARNISSHAGEGRIRFRSFPAQQRLEIIAEDAGPGIDELERVLAGRYRGRNGYARGLVTVQRLASSFDIVTGPSGTRVTITFG